MATHFPPLPLPHKHKDRSVVHSIVRPPVLSLFVRSSDRLWFVRSFVQIIFVQPLCCRNSDCRSSVQSLFIVHSSYSSFVHHPYSSFIVHRLYSSLVSTVTIHRHYSALLFIIVTIHRYYSLLLLFIDAI
jgi:hypothetical protein